VLRQLQDHPQNLVNMHIAAKIREETIVEEKG